MCIDDRHTHTHTNHTATHRSPCGRHHNKYYKWIHPLVRLWRRMLIIKSPENSMGLNAAARIVECHKRIKDTAVEWVGRPRAVRIFEFSNKIHSTPEKRVLAKMSAADTFNTTAGKECFSWCCIVKYARARCWQFHFERLPLPRWIGKARMSTEQCIKLIYCQNKRVVASTVPVHGRWWFIL